MKKIILLLVMLGTSSAYAAPVMLHCEDLIIEKVKMQKMCDIASFNAEGGKVSLNLDSEDSSLDTDIKKFIGQGLKLVNISLCLSDNSGHASPYLSEFTVLDILRGPVVHHSDGYKDVRALVKLQAKDWNGKFVSSPLWQNCRIEDYDPK